ncbi:hypothetical protein V6N11_056070 [Hibiscus sabdariffa]|uniref:Uncharacterized protein n=1 Tax=Hibiscus sabdariffa TaxID=183260 RepID=A0ABR2T2Q3_9ROSI
MKFCLLAASNVWTVPAVKRRHSSIDFGYVVTRILVFPRLSHMEYGVYNGYVMATLEKVIFVDSEVIYVLGSIPVEPRGKVKNSLWIVGLLFKEENMYKVKSIGFMEHGCDPFEININVISLFEVANDHDEDDPRRIGMEEM